MHHLLMQDLIAASIAQIGNKLPDDFTHFIYAISNFVTIHPKSPSIPEIPFINFA